MYDFALVQLPAVSPSGMDFKPCVDGHVIPVSPRDLMLRGNINQVIFMTGTVKDEWTGNLGWFIEELLAEQTDLGMLMGRATIWTKYNYTL